jgi:glycosyltransferase involved in cell wall biosynthesis
MSSVVRNPGKIVPVGNGKRRSEVVVLDTRVVNGSGGGPDKTILNSPRFLTPAGYRNLCAYMHPPGDPGFERLRARAEAAAAPLLSVPDRGPWDWRVVGRLLHICRRERVRIWHGHDYKSNFLGILLRRFWPMRLVTTVHGWGVQDTSRTSIYYRVDRLCLPYYEKVICVSPDLHAECLAAGVPPSNCVLIENAIDTTAFRRQRGRAEAKSQLGLSPDRLVIGAVGRLSDEKGFDLLIQSVDRLLRTGLDVGLILVGEGGCRSKLEALIAQLGLGDRVHLLGYQADTRSLYEAMDVYALSSFREGLPNVLLEAMALGVPLVATRVGGVARLVTAEDDGLLVEAGDQEALTQALARLLRDPALRDRLSQGGRTTVEARYSFAARMRKIQALYDDLLSPARSPRHVATECVQSEGLQSREARTEEASTLLNSGDRWSR